MGIYVYTFSVYICTYIHIYIYSHYTYTFTLTHKYSQIYKQQPGNSRARNNRAPGQISRKSALHWFVHAIFLIFCTLKKFDSLIVAGCEISYIMYYFRKKHQKSCTIETSKIMYNAKYHTHHTSCTISQKRIYSKHKFESINSKLIIHWYSHNIKSQ